MHIFEIPNSALSFKCLMSYNPRSVVDSLQAFRLERVFMT